MNRLPAPPPYFVPTPSPYPVILAFSLFLLAVGFIQMVNGYPLGRWVMAGAGAAIAWVLFGWFGAVIGEDRERRYRSREDRSFRQGMVWFIASEIAFFSAFFGALFYLRLIVLPELAGMGEIHGQTLWPGFADAWPSSGPRGPVFTPMAAWGIPAINTALLLTSGATVTWAHWGLLRGRRRQLLAGLAATLACGAVFVSLQAWEYQHAYNELGLTLGAGSYGATFFMLTGFHGFHVCLGLTILAVILRRAWRGDFTPEHHFAFEGAAWYWHFVDVVWLMLFVFVYWL